jgi:alpha-beta hydrolase superfamily lysophospholipase
VGVAAVAVVAIYAALPVAAGVAAVWPARGTVGPTPPGFRDVTVKTADGVELSAWRAPSENGATILLLHGAGDSRAAVRDHAMLLKGHGFGVLALDLRGHGTSGGRANRLGWEGTRDVRAAVDYLLVEEPGVRIGGMGLSMGGEVLLGATSACPEMEAVVAEGATFRSAAEMRALPRNRSVFRWLSVELRDAAVEILSGASPPAPLLGSMLQAPSTHFFLLAAGTEEAEIAFNRYFHSRLRERTEVWVIPGAGHVQGLPVAGNAYEARIIAFFRATLGRSGPGSP